MTDVGVAVTNLRVVCKIITCVSAFTEIIFLEHEIAREIKSCCRSGHSALQATRRMPLWAQEHKIIWPAGPERDRIFHLRVTACREQGSHCCDERLAWVASRWQGNSWSCSFDSKVLGANCKRANNFHTVCDKFAM